MKNTFLRERPGVIAALLGVFAFMLALTAMTPMFADDYFYVLNLRTETLLTGFNDVLHSISAFRRMHNGRVAAHFFAQLFLWLPSYMFNIANAAMCTLLIYSMFRYTRTGGKRDAVLAFCAFAMIWLLMPAFGHSFLWLTGACSYLWAISFITLFIYPFFSYYMDGGKSCGAMRHVLAMAFAFFAGAYSENGSFSALAVTFCFLVLIYIKEGKLPLDLILRFLAACAGFLYLMLAPTELGKKNAGAKGAAFPLLEKYGVGGTEFILLCACILMLCLFLLWGALRHRKTFCRAAALVASAAVFAASVILAVCGAKGANGALEAVNFIVSDVMLSLVLIYGIHFVLLMWALHLGVDVKKILAALVFGLGSVASLAVFLVAIYFPARGVCVAAVYNSIASLLLLSGICDKTGEKAVKIFATVAVLLMLPTVAAGVADVYSVSRQYDNRLALVEQAKQEGADFLLLPPVEAVGKYSTFWQGEAADYYYGMQEYFGIRRIIIEGAEEF